MLSKQKLEQAKNIFLVTAVYKEVAVDYIKMTQEIALRSNGKIVLGRPDFHFLLKYMKKEGLLEEAQYSRPSKVFNAKTIKQTGWKISELGLKLAEELKRKQI